MNRIERLFQSKREILSIYYTAGYPQHGDTVPVLTALEQSGVDIVEIGMPFSDPLADGPVIQASSLTAINNGMTVEKLLAQLGGMRRQITIPVVLMGYFNTVMRYGLSRFLEQCQAVGVDGVILPDLPFDEYLERYKEMFDRHCVRFIPLIAPQTSESRIRHIDRNTSGFIYVVASAGVTGNITASHQSRTAYYERIKSMNLQNPTLIGFGIKDMSTFEHACQYADGAIVGTAFVNHLTQKGTDEEKIDKFIKNIKIQPLIMENQK